MGADVGPGREPPLIVVSAAASGAGKTLWIEALTGALGARGQRVGVVKHHPHGRSGERQGGRDTDRAAAAGATASVLAEPDLLRLYRVGRDPAVLLARGVAAVRAVAAVDVVLAEGFRTVAVRTRLWVGEGGPAADDGLCIRVAAAQSRQREAVAEVLDRLLAAWA